MGTRVVQVRACLRIRAKVNVDVHGGRVRVCCCARGATPLPRCCSAAWPLWALLALSVVSGSNVGGCPRVGATLARENNGTVCSIDSGHTRSRAASAGGRCDWCAGATHGAPVAANPSRSPGPSWTATRTETRPSPSAAAAPSASTQYVFVMADGALWELSEGAGRGSPEGPFVPCPSTNATPGNDFRAVQACGSSAPASVLLPFSLGGPRYKGAPPPSPLSPPCVLPPPIVSTSDRLPTPTSSSSPARSSIPIHHAQRTHRAPSVRSLPPAACRLPPAACRLPPLSSLRQCLPRLSCARCPPPPPPPPVTLCVALWPAPHSPSAWGSVPGVPGPNSMSHQAAPRGPWLHPAPTLGCHSGAGDGVSVLPTHGPPRRAPTLGAAEHAAWGLWISAVAALTCLCHQWFQWTFYLVL
jgi:hypothetical protein